MVARAYEHHKTLTRASVFEIDDVIDPAESRSRIVGALRALRPPLAGKSGRAARVFALERRRCGEELPER
jgi:acetyl-CoA carboxylase carboxyltransferase component